MTLSHEARRLRRERIAADLKAGKRSRGEIAADHGVSLSLVQQVAAEYGLAGTSRHRRAVKALKVVAGLIRAKEGDTFQTVAARIGTTKWRVEQVYADAVACGIPKTVIGDWD